MKIDKLSQQAQEGLRRWAHDVQCDDMLFDAIDSVPEQWAWMTFLLRYSQDREEWFPKGKFATIQIIEQHLINEAKEAIPSGFRGR